MARAPSAALAGLALLIPGCGPGRAVATRILDAFVEAVQEEDVDRLYCLMAGAAASEELGRDEQERRAGFEAWLDARYEAYRLGRDVGRVELDEQGVALVKLFRLGRGTYVTHAATRAVGPGQVVQESQVRFGYGQVDLSGFPPGTTFYVCGAPVGLVHAVEVPHGPEEVRLEVLDTVKLEWTLLEVEPSGSCPGGWSVASVAVVDGSATTTPIEWVFK